MRRVVAFYLWALINLLGMLLKVLQEEEALGSWNVNSFTSSRLKTIVLSCMSLDDPGGYKVDYNRWYRKS